MKASIIAAALLLSLAWSTDGRAQVYVTTETMTYEDNWTSWVIGQPKTVVNVETGLVVSQTDYDATTALPVRTYSFGALQASATYWADGLVKTVTDANNNTTTYTDYHRGIPRAVTFADQRSKSASVNAIGQIAWVADENGAKTCYEYDAGGRLATTSYPSENAQTPNACGGSWAPTTITYSQVGFDQYGLGPGHWMQQVKTGAGVKNTYFDALWRPVVEEAFDENTVAATLSQTVTRYNTAGQVAFKSYPTQGVSNYAAVTHGIRSNYDALGRIVRAEQDSELGVLATTTEYLTNFVTRTTNPRGYQTSVSYQTYDQPTTDNPQLIQDPEGKVTEITRSVFGELLQIRRSNGTSTQLVDRLYGYDEWRRLCKVIEPETGSTVYDYDLGGNVTRSVSGLDLGNGTDNTACSDARSAMASSPRRATRTYDQRNRVKTLAFQDGRGDQTFDYTPDGLVSSVATSNDGAGVGVVSNSYEYNRRRLMTRETSGQANWYTWSFQYAYDGNGSIASQTYPGGEVVTFAPNALGQPTQVSSSYATYASGIGYFPNGALQRFTYGNGIVHTLTQNARGLPVRSLEDAGNGVAVFDDVYAYDSNGNVASITDATAGGRRTRSMGYDGVDRLSWTASPMYGTSANYWYDFADNITHLSVGGAQSRDQYFCYNEKNQLTNIKLGSCSGASIVGLGYDPQGNLATRNGKGYTFDYGNRLRCGNDAECYRYDGHGRRVLQWLPIGNILSMYDNGGALRYQENQRTGKAINYIYLSGSLIATKAQTTWVNDHKIEYQHTDALGSPVAVTDAARNVIERSEYEPYGQLLNRPLKDGPGYTGHVMDAATGLTYMQQRYYDPAVGRFLSVDPVAADPNSGASFNRYSYANNSPYQFTDPDGRQARELGRWLRAWYDNDGDDEKAREQVHRQHDNDMMVFNYLVDHSAIGLPKDAVQVTWDAVNGNDNTEQGAGAVAGEVADQLTKKKLGPLGQLVANDAATATAKAMVRYFKAPDPGTPRRQKKDGPTQKVPEKKKEPEKKQKPDPRDKVGDK